MTEEQKVTWRDRVELDYELDEALASRVRAARDPDAKDDAAKCQPFDLAAFLDSWERIGAYCQRYGIGDEPLLRFAATVQRTFWERRPSSLDACFWLEHLGRMLELQRLDLPELVDRERWHAAAEAPPPEALQPHLDRLLDRLFEGGKPRIPMTGDAWGTSEHAGPLFHCWELAVGPRPLLTGVAARATLDDLVLATHALHAGVSRHRYLERAAVIDELLPEHFELTPAQLGRLLCRAPSSRVIAKVHELPPHVDVWGVLNFFKPADGSRRVDLLHRAYQNMEPYQDDGVRAAILLELGFDERGVASIAELLSKLDGDWWCHWVPLLLRAHSPWLVPLLHDLLQRKSLGYLLRRIDAYLDGEGANVVEGLVAFAGRRGEKRAFALERLRGYAERGHAALIEASVTRAPAQAAELVRAEVLAGLRRPAAAVMTSAAGDLTLEGALASGAIAASAVLDPDTAPAWLRAIAALPERHPCPPVLREHPWPLVRTVGRERALSAGLLERLCAVVELRYSTIGRFDYDGIADLKLPRLPEWDAAAFPAFAALEQVGQELDPADADALWMHLQALGAGVNRGFLLRHLGGPRSIELAGAILRGDPELETPPIVDFHQLVWGLARRDHPAALAELASARELARGRKHDEVFHHVLTRALDAIRHRDGLSEAQLAGRFVPTYGLGEQGRAEFEYGARTLNVSVSAALEVRLEDDGGKELRSVPEPGKGVDRAWASRLKRRIRWMRGALARAVEAARVRFELELTGMHSRSLEELRDEILAHPWQRVFAGALVWGSYDGLDLLQTFRRGADGRLVDASSEPVDLPGGATIRLVHPLELDAEAARAWAEALARDGLTQPFDQLHRPVIAPDRVGAEHAWLGSQGKPVLQDCSRRLAERPGWRRRDTARRGGRNKAFIWFAERELPELALVARMLCFDSQWDASRAGAPAAGIYFFAPDAPSDPDLAVPEGAVPARVLSDLWLDLRHAAHR